MPTPMPTRAEVLELVNQRVPDFSDTKKDELVTSTLAILAEPRYAKMVDEPLAAVKLAVARLVR